MFEALRKANKKHQYQITWLELDQTRFLIEIKRWFDLLSQRSYFGGEGVSSNVRKELAKEFMQLMLFFRYLVKERVRYGGYGVSNLDLMWIDQNIGYFKREYRLKFGADIADQAGQFQSLQRSLDGKKLAAITAKRDLLVEKKQLIQYWIRGLDYFPEHDDDVALTWQYLGNSETSKVRLFLNVLIKDAERVMGMEDPRPWLKTSVNTQVGLKTKGDVKWTNSQFEKALKADASISFGLRASGECSIEINHLKAELSASAFVGAEGNAKFEAKIKPGAGGEISGKVDAMLGIKIKANANIDVADIFLIETSAEAFAGAMAEAEIEIKAYVDGVAFTVKAEAFAGAKITGKAAGTFKMCGYDIIKSEVTGYLSAGIGAEFKLEFEASAFGGAKFGIKAGTTFGVGAGVDEKLEVHPENIQKIAYSLFYVAYLELLDEPMKSYAWRTYFRSLEDNRALFVKADGLINDLLMRCFKEYEMVIAENQIWNEFQRLDMFQNPQKVAVPLLLGPSEPPREGTRKRRNAFSGGIRPTPLFRDNR